MTKVSANELEEYLHAMAGTPTPDNWLPEDVAQLSDLLSPIAYHLVATAFNRGADPFVSLWMTAFQFGRHYEIRRMELAALEPLELPEAR